MDKSPVKKVKMMDIVRKRPTISPTPREEKEEQVKFTIEKKPAAEQVRAAIDDREARRARMEELTAQEYRHSNRMMQTTRTHEPVPEPKQTIPDPQQWAEKQEPNRGVRYEEQRAPETHVGYEQSRTTTERRHELSRMMPEVSSVEMDRPIAYIPKEKPSREEKKVFERIDRRERLHQKEGKQKKRGGRIFTWVVSCALLGVIAYLCVTVLPRAEIGIVPKPTVEFDWATPIIASTKIAEIDPVGKQIPVAVFAEKKANSFSFPATGSGKNIERKAGGTVTIYNEFSGSQQPLVGGTRLETPDGQIFKLKNRVVVPGATTSGGKLVASSIDAEVIAEKAGEEYNIAPVSKFTIPGFKGTTKFDGFHAESKSPMTGGFVGEGKYPTAEDIKAGKESAETQMKGVLDSFLQTQVVPEGFKTIDSSKKYSVTKEVVNEGVDDQGNFSIYMEAEGSVDGLKEDHVLQLMTALAQQANGEGYEIKSHTLSYGDMTINEKTGEISLAIDFKGAFWRPVVVDEFKRNIMGKTEEELKAYIRSSTSIEKTDVALWPFWVKKVPNDPSRVKVELK